MAKKILLADDSITIQKVIELTFSDEDFDVITVGNGRLALERLPEVRPDVVLCDIIMPEKDGYEVCEQIKSSPQWSHVPVLLLTGAFEPFDQERAARAGYDGSLAKPFEPETLIAKVKDLLARAPRPAATAPTPSTPPVVPFARPAAVVPPPMSSMPPLPPPVLSGSFISDEPFDDEEAPSSPPSPVPVSHPPTPPLAELSSEESEALAPPPAAEGEREDSASTVMFRPAELPWADAPAAAPLGGPASTPGAAPQALPGSAVAEPLVVPAATAATEEPPVFEAVLDEDLDFGPAGFEPAPAPEQAGSETLFSPEPPAAEVTGSEAAAMEGEAVLAEPEPELPPEPVSSIDDLVSGEPEEQGSEPSFVEESPLEPEPATSPDAAETARVSESESAFAVFGRALPEPAPGPELSMPAPAPVPEPVRAVEPGPEPAREPAPVPEPARPPEPLPVAAPAPAGAGPFADLEVSAEEPGPVTASQTAAFPVPVDTVEKIAQRVVAQVSEKVVREIAWEVIPDLAEALIKQEIERLKAELQKT